MKKNLTKKLMLSVLTLAFAVVSLGASTFAWFTLSGSVKVEQLTANVTGGFGLDVTVTAVGEAQKSTWDKDAATWYTGNLPASAFASVLADVKFDAVTPGSDTLTSAQKFKKLNADASKTNLIAFDLNFRITDPTSVKENLYLSLINIGLASDSESEWVADIQYNLTNGGKSVVGTNYKYNILSAARFAIIGEDGNYVFEQDTDTTTNSAYANTTGFSQNGAVDYYNKKMNYVAQDGTVIDDANDLDVDDAVVYNTTKLPNFAFAASTAEKNYNKYKLVEIEAYNDTLNSDNDDTNDTNTGGIFTVTVFIWCEGWDAECINAIFNQELTIDMTYALSDAEGNLKA